MLQVSRLTLDECKQMRKSGQLAARTLEYVEKYIQAGITTDEINKIVHDFILRHNAIPAPLNYHGFPKSCCTSVNDVICHGVPDSTRLKSGDILNVDVTTILNGFYGDTSRTYCVGTVTDRAKALVACAQTAMEKGIEAIEPNGTTGDIGFAINKFTTRSGYHVVREIGGHGIGRKFHTDPFVPSFGKRGKGDPLLPYHCITVEPMINETDVPLKEFGIPGASVKYYATGDGALSAQFEHTVLILEDGYEIMTLP